MSSEITSVKKHGLRRSPCLKGDESLEGLEKQHKVYLSRRDCRFFLLPERESYFILWFLESRDLLDLGENLSLSWEILGVCNPPACVKVPLLVWVIIWLHCAE